MFWNYQNIFVPVSCSLQLPRVNFSQNTSICGMKYLNGHHGHALTVVFLSHQYFAHVNRNEYLNRLPVNREYLIYSFTRFEIHVSRGLLDLGKAHVIFKRKCLNCHWKANANMRLLATFLSLQRTMSNECFIALFSLSRQAVWNL